MLYFDEGDRIVDLLSCLNDRTRMSVEHRIDRWARRLEALLIAGFAVKYEAERVHTIQGTK